MGQIMPNGINAVFGQHPIIEGWTVAAVIVVRLHMGIVQKVSLGGAAAHINQEGAGFLIQLHPEIAGFLVEGFGPVIPAATDTLGRDLGALTAQGR